MVKVVNEIKPAPVKQDNEKKPSLAEEFFNLLICLTSITCNIVKPCSMLNEENIRKINIYKEEIITAIGMIADILNLDEKLNYKIEKKLKEELVAYDEIPKIEFHKIQNKFNSIINDYEKLGQNIKYDRVTEIVMNLKTMEYAIDNISLIIYAELRNL